MNAVNLIPTDQRRGAGAPGRSGDAVYVFLGVLAVAVLMAGALMVTSRSVAAKRDELSSVTQKAQAAEARAGTLQAYTQFASLRQKRQETVSSLAASRFDWSHVMHELARTLPSGASLMSLRASVSPGAAVQGGASDPLRASLNQPALELQGCADGQTGVARVMAALRRMDGVQRVSLSSSQKTDAAGGASGGGASSSSSGGTSSGSSTDCTAGSDQRPQFSMTVFYAAPSTPGAPAAGAPATTAAATPTTTTPGGQK